MITDTLTVTENAGPKINHAVTHQNTTAHTMPTLVCLTAVVTRVNLAVKKDKCAFHTTLYAALGEKKTAMDTVSLNLTTAAHQDRTTVTTLTNAKKTAAMSQAVSPGAHTLVSVKRTAVLSPPNGVQHKENVSPVELPVVILQHLSVSTPILVRNIVANTTTLFMISTAQ